MASKKAPAGRPSPKKGGAAKPAPATPGKTLTTSAPKPTKGSAKAPVRQRPPGGSD